MTINITPKTAALSSVPLLIAILLLFHPESPVGHPFWLTLHLILMPLFPLAAVSMYALTAAYHGTIVWLSRIAMAIYAVYYSSLDNIAGIEAGSLANHGMQAAAHNVLMDPTKTMLANIGIFGWIIAIWLTCFVLYKNRAPKLPLLLLAASAPLLWYDHRIYGPIVYGALAVATIWLLIVKKPIAAAA